MLSENGDAKKILLAAAKCIKEFDSTNGDKDEYKDKAKQRSKNLLTCFFLVATSNNGIDATPTTGSNNISLMSSINTIDKGSNS